VENGRLAALGIASQTQFGGKGGVSSRAVALAIERSAAQWPPVQRSAAAAAATK
jgi:hypothetical protein